jgi:ubiquinone/menaquinone biosynthesis C-methylase UbiE
MENTQYKMPQNLNARSLLHAKYGTNTYPWHKWLFDQYTFPEAADIIEFGCGTGELWFHNKEKIKKDWKMLLTDRSEGMVQSAKEKLKAVSHSIKFETADLDTFETGGALYASCIANHVLYHVPDVSRALETVCNLLQQNGCFYASTVSETNMHELREIVGTFTGNDNFNKINNNVIARFSLDNGLEQLKKYFKKVQIREYEDALEVTDPDDFVNYVVSCNSMYPGITVLEENKVHDFREYIQEIINKKGRIHISKKSGTFIAEKTY